MDRLTQQLSGFSDLVREVWVTGVGGVDFGRALTALAIVLGFLILRGLFTRFVLGFLRRIAARTQTTMDDSLLGSLDGPIRLVPVILGLFIAIDYLAFEDRYAEIGAQVVRTLVVFDLFWGLYQITGPISTTFTRLEEILTKEMADWLIGFLHIAIVFIGAATILEVWGIKIGPILAGLGLFGVAVALGAQDLFKNLIGGILVIAEKRMRVGDWILVDGLVEGTVETIGFRSTLVRRFDKAPVYVPNAKLSDNAITNFSAMTHRRIKWMIGIEYSATIEQLRQIRDEIESHILGLDEFASPSEVATFVRIDRFSDSSIDILLYCFTKTTDWGEWLKIKEALAYRVKEIVEGAGTGFAFPSQSIYVEGIPGDAAEVFVPPATL
ncbi:MAG: mechanosensitive ion channel family protein [Rhodospirillaceae bacterium]|jgi:MscS family membrane protein|nr:mechanosensitive ion channel family protein [Rhodospirillaceae bacterium]